MMQEASGVVCGKWPLVDYRVRKFRTTPEVAALTGVSRAWIEHFEHGSGPKKHLKRSILNRLLAFYPRELLMECVEDMGLEVDDDE